MPASDSGLLVQVRWGVTALDEATSKNIDGITDLIVVAPIKDGFIAAFETLSYSGRLQLVAEALNRLRVTAREHERLVPFSDVTERILSLLDFRIGIIDKNLYGLANSKKPGGALELQPRRYLYLTATFEGGFEPYMRQIWRPLGPFLDLLFCNCEGYITATEHSFDEYIQWVRDNQVESAIFYATTGLTVRDHKYLSKLEALQRGWNTAADAVARDLKLATTTMPYPDEEAAKTRRDPRNWGKTLELGFEAINVLFKLADYYPPEWQTGMKGTNGKEGEGHRLLRATREILLGWDGFNIMVDKAIAMNPGDEALSKLSEKLNESRDAYKVPLGWYRTGTDYLKTLDTAPPAPTEPPAIDVSDVQAGILKPHGSDKNRVRHGALLMFTVRNAVAARRWMGSLVDSNISFEGGARAASLFANIAFTSTGLQHLAMDRCTLDRFPKEFREGLAQRSGIVGDMREHHPRNWQLPDRNGPAFTNPRLFKGVTLPPVELEEVDFVLQLRSTHDDDGKALQAFALRLAKAAKGATLEAIEWLNTDEQNGRFVDHFGYIDGISQPKPAYEGGTAPAVLRDRVALGEVLHGYANDRGDGPPALFGTLDADRPGNVPDTHWRQEPHAKALQFQKNGSYLVVRKIGMETAAFDTWLDVHKADVARQLNITPDAARALLKARVMGRDENGRPLVATLPTGNDNDFDFRGDLAGKMCPHAAHIRRANPRKADPNLAAAIETRAEFNRPTPRLLRRGMLFGERGKGGLMFMAYAASIAEQYEVIQRWLNGGNSTDVASANNDILTGVQPREGLNTFRFVAQRIDADGTSTDVVVRVPLQPVKLRPSKAPNPGDPGLHPFTPLYWGLYLFAPSRSALQDMAKWDGIYIPIEEMREQSIGNPVIEQLQALNEEQRGKEWKRIIEDFVTRDPTEQNISPHVWSTIRYKYGGAFRLDASVPFFFDWRVLYPKEQNFIICAGEAQVMQVLSQWQHFTSDNQMRRIKGTGQGPNGEGPVYRGNAGPIYVTQQPDNKYEVDDLPGTVCPLNYHAESAQTNAALFAYRQTDAFIDGYNAGKAILDGIKGRAVDGPIGNFVKIELKREYFQPAIGELWRLWYGLPDGQNEALKAGGWSWKEIVATLAEDEIDEFGETIVARKYARCPGDFMAPSRGAVFPRPNEAVREFARVHGDAILEAGRAFVAKYRGNEASLKTPLIRELFDAVSATPNSKHGDEVLARNVIGTMIGAIPPMDANLRNIMLEFLLEKTLWRHQAAMLRAKAGKDMLERTTEVQAALEVPISAAICKRPAPDILYRTAKHTTTIKRYGKSKRDFPDLKDLETKTGDLVVVSLVSASQRSLASDYQQAKGDVSVVFGGKRTAAYQGYIPVGDSAETDPGGSDYRPVHACPAQKMAMGGMTGIIAALLDAGAIQALPASLIVRISGFVPPPPVPPVQVPPPPASG